MGVFWNIQIGWIRAATVIRSALPLLVLMWVIPDSSLGHVTLDDTRWVLSREVDGIQVYHRQLEGSPLKELRITFSVEAGLLPILGVLRDIDAFPEWIFHCRESRLIEGSGSEIVYYHRIDFPWPLADRDAVSFATYQQDPRTGIVHSLNRALSGTLPPQDGAIRLEDMEIRWTITPTAPGQSDVVYYLRTDPAGSLPAWLINLAIDKGPVKSMQAFRDMVQRPEYASATAEGVEEYY